MTRLNESSSSKRQYLSLITIVRDISLLKVLDNSTLSTLQGNIISLKKYTLPQIIDILNYRTQNAIKDGALSLNLIELISKSIVDSGDL